MSVRYVGRGGVHVRLCLAEPGRPRRRQCARLDVPPGDDGGECVVLFPAVVVPAAGAEHGGTPLAQVIVGPDVMVDAVTLYEPRHGRRLLTGAAPQPQVPPWL